MTFCVYFTRSWKLVRQLVAGSSTVSMHHWVIDRGFCHCTLAVSLKHRKWWRTCPESLILPSNLAILCWAHSFKRSWLNSVWALIHGLVQTHLRCDQSFWESTLCHEKSFSDFQFSLWVSVTIYLHYPTILHSQQLWPNCQLWPKGCTLQQQRLPLCYRVL